MPILNQKLLLRIVLLEVLLAWSLVVPFLWPSGGTPETVGRHLQHHARVMRSFLIVLAGVVLCGMTRWVYWALCRALAPAQHEVGTIQPRDAQALRDLCTRRDAEDTGAEDWEP